ncbi:MULTISPECIES: ABC transporter substrate-binding protein [Lysinibacillus]|uniref:ABC transporter substrate-binding protein n=1 Tax=Lysinibacillus capsici TaxID=2115968 RepID=A0ABY8KM91_9BACI|nr:ABC transporter substrate-binding protein [Lysinibacillus capsici]MCT1540330.1 ABC transporter substrate-binding protein [Lysinibacillus capsici]MCT1571398.1 ABC transporter substrate-binding protein [Lysinibacillus capsici]MCT1647812.1 ABC transporter substrate-binding protein [Lysinibacillus capsici]MCT1726353.1 ABC transporter substrate-binding protein [Lysinibacillus capsici]MCT1783458.1 ABC transporter substrate-binding protein [Lysinibacillus capsici]
MKKKFLFISFIALFMLILAACGEKKAVEEEYSTDTPKEEEVTQTKEESTNENGTRTIEYLGESYEVPEKVERIVVTGAMEAMEDMVVLDVHPVGAIAIGGKFPELYASVTDKAESIGEKIKPNFEKILELNPDVILGSTKFPEEVQSKLEKIAPTILVSHISTNWESNLNLLAELTGKQADAEKILSTYKADIEAAKSTLTEKLQDQKVAAIRIRGGQAYVYPKEVFLNAVLYGELGLAVPNEVAKAKSQEAISVEQLADMNPDYLFVQFSTDENADAPNALEDFKKNPIIQNITAFKNDRVFVNVLDPLMEGGPAYSRIKFLEAIQQNLVK